jgi:hypothetical protein
MALLIKYHNVQIQYETKRCAILNSIAKLNNQYVSKALSYFDKYLKDNNTNQKTATDSTDLVSKEFKENVATADSIHLIRSPILDEITIAATQYNGNFAKVDAEIEYAQSKRKDLFEPYDGDGKGFEKDPNKWDTDYYNYATVKLMTNFSKERLNHVKQVAVKVLSKKK